MRSRWTIKEGYYMITMQKHFFGHNWLSINFSTKRRFFPDLYKKSFFGCNLISLHTLPKWTTFCDLSKKKIFSWLVSTFYRKGFYFEITLNYKRRLLCDHYAKPPLCNFPTKKTFFFPDLYKNRCNLLSLNTSPKRTIFCDHYEKKAFCP